MQDILFVAKVEEIKKRVCEAEDIYFSIKYWLTTKLVLNVATNLVIGLIALLIIIRVKFKNHFEIWVNDRNC